MSRIEKVKKEKVYGQGQKKPRKIKYRVKDGKSEEKESLGSK